MFKNIRIVLVATTHPGNIGATARAMKNMLLQRLYLVQPKIFPHVEATARAAGADNLLAQAIVVENLDEALRDCHLVIGTSARTRDLPLTLLDPRQAAEKVVAMLETQPSQKPNEIAIVFGRESSGLSNEELQLCHYHLHIPTNPEFSSLNIAAAVQIVAYEIMQTYRAKVDAATTCSNIELYDALATNEEMRLFYEHFAQVLIAIGYLDPKHPKKLMPRLRRLFNRIHLEHLEVNMLRGVLADIQKIIKKDDFIQDGV
jgi:tRNA (cytidine32/uridine32-2'-O)-methyltransferase